MLRQTKPNNNPTSSVQANKFCKIAASLVQAFFRSKISSNTRQALQQLNKYSTSLAKKTQLFAKTISKIISKKQQKNKKLLFSLLLQVKISDILSKRQKLTQLKPKSRNQSAGLISCILTKMLKQKLSSNFNELRTKSSIKSRIRAVKLYGMLNCLEKIQSKQLRDGLRCIKLQGFNKLARCKRCFVLERFYSRKKMQQLLSGFSALQKNMLKKEDQKPLQFQQKHSQKQEITQLQQQQKLLQDKLSKIKSQSLTTLSPQQTQLSKLQQEYDSMRFSFQLLQQDNQYMKQTIQQRQRQAQQTELKKQQFQIMNPIPHLQKQFSENQLWKSVFDNLLCYLYQIKTRKENQVQKIQFSPETMIEALVQPLVHLSDETVEQLKEENDVLKELLNTYCKAFNKDPAQVERVKQGKVSGSLVIKEKRYLLNALQCLTSWNTTTQAQVEGMKVALQKLKNMQETTQLLQ